MGSLVVRRLTRTLGWSDVLMPQAAKHAGFTLLEMLVVMALIALLAAVVVPSFSRWFDQSVRRSEAADALGQVRQLRDRSILMGLDFDLNPATAAQLLPDNRAAVVLPTGWKWQAAGPASTVVATNKIAASEGNIRAIRRFYFHRNGTCEAGSLALLDAQGQRWALGMAAPRCDLTLKLAP